MVREGRALWGLLLLGGLLGGALSACSESKEVVLRCEPACAEHGTCVEGRCECGAGYGGDACDACAAGFIGYPQCVDDPCDPDPCGGHGACDGGECACATGYTGDACDACGDGFVGYPECADDPCEPDPCAGHGTCDAGECACAEGYAGASCESCAQGFTGYPSCVPICEALACSGATPLCDEAGETCVACLTGEDCPELRPICDEGTCVACLSSEDPVPAGICEGVCGLVPPECEGGNWYCVAPGWEGKVETSCDGFDNDCDGQVDEGVCDTCTPDLTAIESSLGAIWDIDFDYACRTYLTSLITGADFARVIEPTGEVVAYYGNANQNMGYGLVDPNPDKQRVVVLYSCCAGCSCMASNGLTLLYTCDDDEDPDCGCAGQSNCPGFLNAPFIATGFADTSVPLQSSYKVTTPTGLAAGPGQTYFVGNLRPTTCTTDEGCVPCDPEHPDLWCTTDGSACCDSATLGRLAQFTLPEPDADATWRVVHIFEGEAVIALATGRDNSVMVGTDIGNLYRYDPWAHSATLVRHYDGVVFSITQDRRDGDWYIERRNPVTLHRLWEDGTDRPLPPGVPLNPPGNAVLQYGPDGALYRLQGNVNGAATLDRWPLPLWSPTGGPCSDLVLCEDPALCQGGVCVAPGE